MSERLLIERLGHKGDGVATGPIYVPYALPGETVAVEIAGERARLIAIEAASLDRIEPFCPYFGFCGGCAIQHLAEPAYRDWKRGLVIEALAQARIETQVAALLDAHGSGRRRATLHARRGRVGFAVARSHEIVEIAACPILVPALSAVLAAARAIERLLGTIGKPIDLLATATVSGVDLDLRGAGRIGEALRLSLADLALTLGLARLSIHGEVVVEPRAPLVRFGRAAVFPPAGAFLQATEEADGILARLVQQALAGARRVADLFSGCGTLALVLAENSGVTAFDLDGPALRALEAAARRTPGLKPLRCVRRDLFHRPLLGEELASFDAVVFDPPRAGAEAQARRLADSKIGRVVGVSCSPATFARDAAILMGGGFALRSVTPVDQFRHSAHVELVGLFER
jgi:23S rRNA (uracil1939-C5)-methyltransferase